MSKSFAEKLNLVMKVLSFTRAQVAVELEVDKSIVGRWLNGAVSPSSYNLNRLTLLVASRVDGFRLIDWERDLTALEELLGAPSMLSPQDKASRLPPGLPIALMNHILDTTELRGPSYEGFFRSTRPYAQMPGRFIHDQIMMRLDDCGLLRLHMGTGGVLLDGWVMPLQGKLFVIASEMNSGVLGFAILNGVNAKRALTLDGILLNCALDTSHSPIACAIVVEQTRDLTGDTVADDRLFNELAIQNPIAPEGSVPDHLVAHLLRDIGPAQHALGGEMLLSMSLARSLSRGV